jgi:ADP-heptose:LPS heptosyltransferase/glycosyltransferase involved in cell wall biosynthesis
MKILCVLFRTLGDVVMGTTVLRAIKAKYPDSTIDFMTEKPYVNTLEGNPDINEIIVGSTYMDANMTFIKGKYDKIFRLNMANHEETCWHHLEKWQNQHLMEWYAKKAGIEKLTDYHHYLYLTEKDKSVVERYWNSITREGKFVAMHTSSGAHAGPQSRVESKDWPIEHFNALADDLIAAGYNVVQIGAFSDKKLSNPAVIDATGKLTFKQHVEFFKHFSAYVGNDSGPAYLAAESGIPCLLIMGSTQNKGLNNGPSVGPCHPNVAYIEPQRPNNPMCAPVPCYTHCQIGKVGGCVIDVSPKDVKKKVWEMLGNHLPISGDKGFKADDIKKIKENSMDVHTTIPIEKFSEVLAKASTPEYQVEYESKNPFIVVGMLTYNEEKYIKYSLGAVYDHVDHIVVVDSFSTDNTIRYIQELDTKGKITIIQRAWNNNYAEARNTYLEYIKENFYPLRSNLYYFRIDADEVYYSSKVAELKNIIAQNAEANAFRFNFYTFEGDHTHLSENNPIETRACVFKYSPDIQYVSALHEMPVKGVGQKVLYTHNPAHDSALGVCRIDEFWYCHFAWCDVDRCFTKAKNYTEHYVVQGTETKERLSSIENNKDSWWWKGHSSNYEFKEQYPEIFEKLGRLHAFKVNAKNDELLTGGKFTMIDGKLVFESQGSGSAGIVSQEDQAVVEKLQNGLFSMKDGQLAFDPEELQKPMAITPITNNSMGPKLSAFTIVKNAIKYDYPIVESINSVLPLVDEYIVNIGTPDEDGTGDLLKKHFGSNPKVKMFESEWEGRDQGIKFLTSQTNKAKDMCLNKWALYVQADELYHENELDEIKKIVELYDQYDGMMAVSFNFLHFDGDYATVNPNGYPKEFRLVKKDKTTSIHDAVTFGAKAFSNVPLSSMKDSCPHADITVFHYGWVREPKKMTDKLVSFDSFYHNDEELKEMHKDFDLKHRDGYDYGKRDNHLHYIGPHPRAAHDRIRKFEKEHGAICKNFVFGEKPKTKKYVVERVVNGKNLTWENDLITDEFIYVGDHIAVPGIGDSILHTGVIREVAKRFPDKKIILRTMAELDAFENNPRIFKVERELLPHPIDIPTGHYMEQKCRYFGIDNPEIRGEIFISDRERVVAEETLQILSGNKPTIMFCFNSTNPKKNWIAENWVKIVDVLNEKYDVYQIDQSIHYSRAKDRPEEYGRPVVYPTIPNARQELRNAAGSIRKMMALMSVCKKYLGVNTSFMNIASCFGDDNIVFQHDVDMDGTKLRALMGRIGFNPTATNKEFMDMNFHNAYNEFRELRPEWPYPGTKYFDAHYSIEEVVGEIKKLWMQESK